MLAAPPARKRARLALAAAVGIALVALSARPLPVVHAGDRAFRAAFAAFDAGRYAEALAAGEALVLAYPRDSRSYVLRGMARSQLNDLAGAEADYEEAIDIDQSPWAKRNLERLRAYMKQQGGDAQANPASK
jgi:tetratricopeptide (TPR) repeat protein